MRHQQCLRYLDAANEDIGGAQLHVRPGNLEQCDTYCLITITLGSVVVPDMLEDLGCLISSVYR